MNYLALDLGTKTGVAYNIGDIPGYDNWNFTPRRGGGTAHQGKRFHMFEAHLGTHHMRFPVQHILYEEVRAHRGVLAAHIHGGFLGVLAAWAYGLGIPMTPVGVGTIKRRITGKGNANKQAVMRACRARGHDPRTNDEADALALLLGVLEMA